METDYFKTYGTCAICGHEGKLSFEHVPPQAAYNDSPIFVQGHVHLTEQTSPLYGKKMKSNRGSGGYTLCESCNKKTGSWYGSAFNDFVHQGMAIIGQYKHPVPVITGTYKIKPLNVIKQIITMFLAIEKGGILRADTNLIDFILNKSKTQLPSRYGVYLYSNMASQSRMMGYTFVGGDTRRFKKWSEINFKPFGYFLTDESDPPNRLMCKITSWSNFSYNQEVSVQITTCYLHVDSWIIGTYK
ncbi:MAG: hypothetical protein M0P58_08330 [Bacteroidales bacterium]|nr:hypothetical protein [Bacteroidales bacterium]